MNEERLVGQFTMDCRRSSHGTADQQDVIVYPGQGDAENFDAQLHSKAKA